MYIHIHIHVKARDWYRMLLLTTLTTRKTGSLTKPRAPSLAVWLVNPQDYFVSTSPATGSHLHTQIFVGVLRILKLKSSRLHSRYFSTGPAFSPELLPWRGIIPRVQWASCKICLNSCREAPGVKALLLRVILVYFVVRDSKQPGNRETLTQMPISTHGDWNTNVTDAQGPYIKMAVFIHTCTLHHLLFNYLSCSKLLCKELICCMVLKTDPKPASVSQVKWCIPAIPASHTQTQDHCKFKDSWSTLSSAKIVKAV